MTGDRDEVLPGLEPPAQVAGDVELAARRTIAALADTLEERHAVATQALVTIARQIDRATNSTKAKDYAVANLVAQLRETYVLLMPEEGGDQDAFDELADALRAAAMDETRRAAALRDAAES